MQRRGPQAAADQAALAVLEKFTARQRDEPARRSAHGDAISGDAEAPQSLRAGGNIPAVIFTITDDNQEFAAPGRGGKRPPRLDQGAVQGGATEGNAAAASLVEDGGEGVGVAGRRANHEGAAGERDQADAVSPQLPEQPADRPLGGGQAGRRQIVGEHATGDVEGDEEVQPLALLWPCHLAPLGTTKCYDEEQEGGGRQEISQRGRRGRVRSTQPAQVVAPPRCRPPQQEGGGDAQENKPGVFRRGPGHLRATCAIRWRAAPVPPGRAPARRGAARETARDN